MSLKFKWQRWSYPHSTQGRYRPTVGVPSLIVFVMVGALVDLGIRDRAAKDVVQDARPAICPETSKAHGRPLTVEDSPEGARFVLRPPVMRQAAEHDVADRPADRSRSAMDRKHIDG
ncbi:hypothetical protein SAMN04489712_11560 [Thermomonospora echinospora]|uniref:Uncharacterized protein n=1 Tax=Thermomonospora echinospora TaxID=1992 RepID=A0A1H6DBK4_9ACTN|nr:hypothetical protein SAMN04489712_11560 [Thermomonospora echinospora]